MFRSASIAALIFFLLIPCSWAEERQAEGMLVFTSESRGFRISRPAQGWDFKEDTASATYTLTQYPVSLKGKLQVTVRIKSLTSGYPTALSVRDRTLEWAKARKEYSNPSKVDARFAGRAAPGLEIEMVSAGQTFRVQQYYMVEKGLEYTLGFFALKPIFERNRKSCLAILKTFGFVEIKLSSEELLKQMAARCGSEMGWARSWKEASERARKENRLVLVLVRAISGFQTTNTFMTISFMDPDILGLVQTRFTAWKYQRGTGAPFEDHAVYGLGPSTFGTSVLIVRPDGQVVGDTFSMEVTSLHDLMVTALAADPDTCRLRPPRGCEGAKLAQWYIIRGAYQKAALVLASVDKAALMKARLLRRLRKGEEALLTIDEARTGGDYGPDMALEKALVLIKMGRFREAYAELTVVLTQHPIHGRIPETRYLLGLCSFRIAGAQAAQRRWKGLIDEHRDSRWAQKAAGVLAGTGFSLGLGERARWPSEALLKIQHPSPLEKLDRKRAAKAETDAMEYLLSRQRRDGSWICPSEVARASDKVPHDFTVAITAIAGMSLLPYKKDPRINRSLHMAVGYLKGAREAMIAAGEKVYFMDYAVWGKSYLLCFWARCVKEGLLKLESEKAFMEELVSELGKKQKPYGGWSYYVTRDLKAAASEQSISFITAAALMALFEAAKAGIHVSDEITAKGLACMGRFSNPDGTFEYMMHPRAGPAKRKPNLAGAAGRGPLCALTLYRWGKGSLGGVRNALEIFDRFKDAYSSEKRKSLMHTAPNGQGSHYLMFDYAYAAEAIMTLPKAQQGAFRKMLLTQILDSRCQDGSYLDNPLNGPHYGTAMALMALRILED